MTTAKERFEVLTRLERAGIRYEDRDKLRRIALTLQRWHEGECGTDNGCIERDETTGKVFWLHSESGTRYRILDRETGALKRLKAIMRPYTRRFVAYVQGDPRGASLYLVPRKYLKGGHDINGCYSNGIAIY